jgi:predicted HicB family RNase H-like nuclease
MGKVVMMKEFPDDLHKRAKLQAVKEEITLHKRAKLQAVKEEITLKAIVIKALTEYLEKVGG